MVKYVREQLRRETCTVRHLVLRRFDLIFVSFEVNLEQNWTNSARFCSLFGMLFVRWVRKEYVARICRTVQKSISGVSNLAGFCFAMAAALVWRRWPSFDQSESFRARCGCVCMKICALDHGRTVQCWNEERVSFFLSKELYILPCLLNGVCLIKVSWRRHFTRNLW